MSILDNKHKVLDKCVKIITIAIFFSLKLLMQKLIILKKKERWWDKDCQTSLQKIYQTQKYQAFDKAAGIVYLNKNAIFKNIRLNLWKTVKKAKQKYYQKSIDSLNHQNIFQAIK